MENQDIFSALERHESYHHRKRLLLLGILLSIGYLTTTYLLESLIRLISAEASISAEHHISTPSSSQVQHLIKALDQRRSSYRSQDSLLGVTAIITLCNSRERKIDNVNIVLRLLSNYPYLKEIIIWNDDVIHSQVNLDVEDLRSRLSPSDRSHAPILRVVNSPGGMKEMSGHMACSLAKYDTCYHTDEKILNLNLDTLYTKYLESDGESQAAIVDRATPEEYLAETRYNVFQPDHSLNSGLVSQLARGSFAAKILSTRYFQQLSTTLISHHDPPLGLSIPLSVSNDIQFSVWSNRRPLKLITPTQSLILINPGPSQLRYLDPKFIHLTYRKLNETIQSSDPFLVPNLFPRASTSLNSKQESEIGVASAYDDRSMLITNSRFSTEWTLAIDGELSTCWKDSSTTKIDFFFGLNLVKATLLNKLIAFGYFEPQNWKLEVYTLDKKQWMALPVTPIVTIHQEPPVTKFVYDLSRFSSVLVKKIRLMQNKYSVINSSKSDQNSITICGWMLNDDWVI